MITDKNGDLTFMCTECHSIIKVHGIPKMRYYIADGFFTTYYSAFFKFCPSCGIFDEDSDVVVEVDPDIIDIIICLNRKGYKTFYCCSGHTNIDSDTYIVFRKPRDMDEQRMKNLLESLTRYFCFNMSFSDNIYIGIKAKEIGNTHFFGENKSITEELRNEEWKKRHQSHLDMLRNWANDLDDFGNGEYLKPINVKTINVIPYFNDNHENVDRYIYDPLSIEDSQLIKIMRFNTNDIISASSIARFIRTMIITTDFKKYVNIKAEEINDKEFLLYGNISLLDMKTEISSLEKNQESNDKFFFKVIEYYEKK